MPDHVAVVKLVPKEGPEFRKRDAKVVLEECIKEDFETVIVHGYKDGKIYTKSSASVNCLEIIGALTVARGEFWERQ